MALFLLNEKELAVFLQAQVNQAMLKEAEPIIKEALAEIERRMRKTLAAHLIAHIEKNFIVERDGADLRIIVKQAVNQG